MPWEKFRKMAENLEENEIECKKLKIARVSQLFNTFNYTFERFLETIADL